jgi:hypothetical protein
MCRATNQYSTLICQVIICLRVYFEIGDQIERGILLPKIYFLFSIIFIEKKSKRIQSFKTCEEIQIERWENVYHVINHQIYY